MKFKLNYLLTLPILFLLLGVLSCDSDDYPDVNNYDDQSDEIKSFVVRPGFNKVLIEGGVEDANISEVKIYWNDQSESVTVPVKDETISVQLDNLEEGYYVFQAEAIGAQERQIDLISAGTEVYGSTYEGSLENRTLSNSELDASFLSLSFNSTDETSGILGTELIYTNVEDEEQELVVRPDRNSLNIPDFMSGSTLKHRSYYLYSPLSLDTLYTAYTSHKPFVLPVLQNAAVPYVASEVNGRWGTLGEPWITNDAAKNHDGFGGWDEKNGNIFNLESGWGSPFIVEGKIHQVVMAEPANYRLTVEVLNTNHDSNPDGAYFVITKGNTGLPDVVDVETASDVIGYQKIGAAGTYTVDFVLDEASEISIGEVATQNGNFYCNITSWNLGLSD